MPVKLLVILALLCAAQLNGVQVQLTGEIIFPTVPGPASFTLNGPNFSSREGRRIWTAETHASGVVLPAIRATSGPLFSGIIRGWNQRQLTESPIRTCFSVM